MDQLSQMEVLQIGELLRAEELGAKKAQYYSEQVQDGELRKLFGSFADAHREKIQGLLNKVRLYSGKGEQSR